MPRPPARPTPEITCVFTGGPLDGQRLAVRADLGSYHVTAGGARHVYYRRSHPSALIDPDTEEGKHRAVQPSPPIFDHQPRLTLGAPKP